MREIAGDGVHARNGGDHGAGQGLGRWGESVAGSRCGLNPAVRVVRQTSPSAESRVPQGFPEHRLNALRMTGIWIPEGTLIPVGDPLAARADSRHRCSQSIEGRPKANWHPRGYGQMPHRPTRERATAVLAPTSGAPALVARASSDERRIIDDRGRDRSRLTEPAWELGHRSVLLASTRLRLVPRRSVSGGKRERGHYRISGPCPKLLPKPIAKPVGNRTSLSWACYLGLTWWLAMAVRYRRRHIRVGTCPLARSALRLRPPSAMWSKRRGRIRQR